MGCRYQLEPSGQALADASPDEQRSRSEDDNLQRPGQAGILVPQVFHHLGPVRHLLYLVQHEYRPVTFGLICQQTGCFPLLFDPTNRTYRRKICGRVMGREPGPLGGLERHGGLTHLSRSGNHLDEPARFGQSAREFVGLGPYEAFGHRIRNHERENGLAVAGRIPSLTNYSTH